MDCQREPQLTSRPLVLGSYPWIRLGVAAVTASLAITGLIAPASGSLARKAVSQSASSAGVGASVPLDAAGFVKSGVLAPDVAGIHKIKHVVVIMQENRSFDHYFGTYPGANGIPMHNGVPVACIPTGKGGCIRPYHDKGTLDAGGPHHFGERCVRRERRGDERIHQGGAGRSASPPMPDAERSGMHSRHQGAGRDGLPRLARDPELLGVRRPFRPPGPHVRAGRVVEPARAPLHGVGLVRQVHRAQRSLDLHERSRAAHLAAPRAGAYAHLRMDRSHVPAARAASLLALLRRGWHADRLPPQGRPVQSGLGQASVHALVLEPAAQLRHGRPERPRSTTSSTSAGSTRRRRRGNLPSVAWIAPNGRTSDHGPASSSPTPGVRAGLSRAPVARPRLLAARVVTLCGGRRGRAGVEPAPGCAFRSAGVVGPPGSGRPRRRAVGFGPHLPRR